MMAPLPTRSSSDTTNGVRPPLSPYDRPKSASQAQSDEARLIFDKTLAGHYRQGKTGYKQVGALFLTWADDDLQCKNTEVSV